MKTDRSTFINIIVFGAALLALWFAGAQPAVAQEPEPACDAKSGAPVPGVRCSPDGTWYMLDRGTLPEDATEPALTQSTGGPDDYGYTWDDSVPFNWIDVSGGTDTGMSGTTWGKGVGPVSLPFPFKYYENTYNQVYIAASGYLAFTKSNYWNSGVGDIPSPRDPNNIVAPYAVSMYIGPGSRIRYQTGGAAPNRYFVVEWYQVSGGPPEDTVGGNDTYHFEVILYETGDIVFQYKTMDAKDGRWCENTGIEDSRGLDGLAYLGFCRLPSSNTAVRFYRPAPAARIRIDPLYQGRFTRAGETVTFQVPIHNTGELGSDTYDLSASSLWPVSLYTEDGATLLADTDSDGMVDTGSVGQGDIVTFTVKITTPNTVNIGDNNLATVTARSSVDASKSRTASLRTAVPAPFAQAYIDYAADGATKLYLAQPTGQAEQKVTWDKHYGYPMSVAEMPNGFAYFWSRSRRVGTAYVREIEYSLLNRYGESVRGVTKLTNHSGATITIRDNNPAVAVAPNGRIGVLWQRYLWNPNTFQFNYNVYFAVLDSDGSLLYGPANLTNNAAWGEWGDLNVPRMYSPHIVATGDNRFVLAWRRSHQESGGWVDDVYYAVQDSMGGVVKPVTRFTADTPGWDEWHYDPNLAQLTGNKALLTWAQRSNGNMDIYYAVLDSAGGIAKSPASTGISGWNPDAAQLANGNVVVAGESWDGSNWRTRYVVLDSAYNLLAGPTTLSNPAGVTGDYSVSVAPSGDRAVLTWMDRGGSYRRNLYYALVGANGSVLTPPQIFRTSQGSEFSLYTSYEGYGNTTYSWTPPAGADGVVQFAGSLFGGPPGGNAGLPVHVTNHSTTIATGVVLTATLDSALTYVSDTSGVSPTLSGDKVVWNLPDLGFLEEEDFTLYVQVPISATYGTLYPVDLALASKETEANNADNSASAEVMAARQIFLPVIHRMQ